MAGSLVVSDLEHDAPRHVAGQLDDDAAARHGNLDWRKRHRFGEQDPNGMNSCAVANPEGQADVGGDDRGRSLVPVLHKGVEVDVLATWYIATCPPIWATIL